MRLLGYFDAKGWGLELGFTVQGFGLRFEGFGLRVWSPRFVVIIMRPFSSQSTTTCAATDDMNNKVLIK